MITADLQLRCMYAETQIQLTLNINNSYLYITIHSVVTTFSMQQIQY
jgi:hypothetical protein